MCGIVGAIGNFNSNTKDSLNFISHRGPDSTGSYCQKNIFLGHTRLSIQDLSSNANQPMFSTDGRYVIIFNGEIYNHIEIRNQHLSDFIFKSTGDTETVLNAYIKFGTSILSTFNGIFAFAIFDTKTEEIIIARDHFGVKPLYIYKDSSMFLFGSEIKSFLPFGINKEISPSAISNYIKFLWSPGEQTPFLYVRKLLPGHFLKFKLSNFSQAKDFKFYQNKNIFKKSVLSEEELINKLEVLLLNAVQRQMLSDVQVGFFLSGGLDSSLLVAMAKKINPNKKLKCFTIDIGENKSNIDGFVDDLFYAKKVATFLNVELNVVKANFDIVNNFDKMIWHLDEPQADAAPLNVLNIATLAKLNNIKVLIGGAAGDDLFSGYRRHQALYFEKYIEKIPSCLLKLLAFLGRIIPVLTPSLRRFKKIISNIDKPSVERQLGYFEWMSTESVKLLFSDEWKKKLKNYSPFKYFEELQKELDVDVSVIDRMLYWELKTFLVDHNLNYTDKLGMAEGVEVRVPFLDLELVEFSNEIPTQLKMKGKETKYILKKVAERYLPLEVVYRPKTGFGAPVRKWITNDLQMLINNRLSYENLERRGIFNPNKVWDLINNNQSGKIDASYSVWALLAIESWFIQFVDQEEN
jgi:asparagine synthase (glutamine-hydrolysing)